MSQQERHGFLIWEGVHIEWFYETWHDKTLLLRPHFKLIATHPKTHEKFTWDDVQISSSDVGDTIKGIRDFLKLPPDVWRGVCDNVVAAVFKDERQPQSSFLGV